MTELFTLDGKVALVTGGSTGIGRSIAATFVAAGARVYIASRRAELGRTVAGELGPQGECVSLPADVSTELGCRALAEALRDREPALHVLVNNAGVSWGGDLDDHDDASWSRVLDVNLKAPFHLVRYCRPMLEAAATDDPARVITIGSGYGLQVPNVPVYSYGASKAAVHHLTRHLARDLGPRITVNAIAPGPFESEMMAESLEAHGEVIVRRTVLKRIGRPDDIGGTALYLASRAGSYVTGAVIPVDGGMATTR